MTLDGAAGCKTGVTPCLGCVLKSRSGPDRDKGIPGVRRSEGAWSERSKGGQIGPDPPRCEHNVCCRRRYVAIACESRVTLTLNMCFKQLFVCVLVVSSDLDCPREELDQIALITPISAEVCLVCPDHDRRISDQLVTLSIHHLATGGQDWIPHVQQLHKT